MVDIISSGRVCHLGKGGRKTGFRGGQPGCIPNPIRVIGAVKIPGIDRVPRQPVKQNKVLARIGTKFPANVIQIGQDSVIDDHRGTTHRLDRQSQLFNQVLERVFVDGGIVVKFRGTRLVVGGKVLKFFGPNLPPEAAVRLEESDLDGKIKVFLQRVGGHQTARSAANDANVPTAHKGSRFDEETLARK